MLEVCLLAFLTVTGICDQRAPNKGRINELNDIKEWKHLLKTKTNVLIYFAQNGLPSNPDIYKVLLEAADKIRGIGTLASVDCSSK